MSHQISYNKIFRHLDKLEAIQRNEVSAPINIEIDLSNRCSLGCEWCHFAYTHSRGHLSGKSVKPVNSIPSGDLMETDLAFKIIKQLEFFGIKSITWTGGGEPTLHPDFDEIVSSVNIDQGLYTNGTMIWEERAQLLKQKCTWVYVSMDEVDRENYARHKGADKFIQVCDAITSLVQAPGKATIGLGFLINKSNFTNSYEMVKLGYKLGVDYIQFRPTVLSDVQHPGRLSEETGWMTDAIASLEKLSTFDKVIVDIDRFKQHRDWTGHGYQSCYWSAIQCVITPNGKVWVCVNKREFLQAELGDLNFEKFSDIWERRRIAGVDDDCRLMCRGHLVNLLLNELFKKNDHGNFV